MWSIGYTNGSWYAIFIHLLANGFDYEKGRSGVGVSERGRGGGRGGQGRQGGREMRRCGALGKGKGKGGDPED